MNNTTAVQVPALDIDAMMLKKYGQQVSPNGKLERRIVANLIAALAAKGFNVCYVDDGEEITYVDDAKSAMELIFNLDEAWVRFKNKAGKPRTIFLVLGEGCDILCDWSYVEGDADGFNSAMAEFDPEAYA